MPNRIYLLWYAGTQVFGPRRFRTRGEADALVARLRLAASVVEFVAADSVEDGRCPACGIDPDDYRDSYPDMDGDL